MTRCDDGEAGPPLATGLLVFSSSNPAEPAYQRLCAALDARGIERGALVGPVLPVTSDRERLIALESYVEAATHGSRPADADADLLEALAPIERFAWDEGAETF